MKKQARRLVYLFLAFVLSAGIMGYLAPPVARAACWTGSSSPAVTSITPTYGTAGTVVQIDGSNFIDNSLLVWFGNVEAPNWNVIDQQDIRATAPATPAGTTVDVIVANINGCSATSSYDQFTYPDVPTVSSVTPSSGPTAGHTPLVINGANFQGATAVYFGNVADPSFYVNSSGTAIFTNTPPGTGAVTVTVVTPVGSSSPSNADVFTYTLSLPPIHTLPAFWPTVTGVNPDMGSVSGGTQVTITGTNFNGATKVDFGSNAAASFKVISDTSVTATSPPGSVLADVTVTTPLGTSPKSTADEFLYTSPLFPTPTVTAISPVSGPAVGGTPVTITGTYFGVGQTVKFGSNAATAVTVKTSTSLTAVSPAGTGTVDVTVTSPGGTSATSNADKFTYTTPGTPAPTVTAISPVSGPAAGGTQVTVTGTNLTGATTVDFGSGNPATKVSVNSAGTQITATAPPGTGTVDVLVTTPGGTSATGSTDQFTYTPVASPPSTGQTVMRFYIGNTDYFVNDQVQSMDIAPVIMNSRTLLPIRYVATPLGATVDWDQAAQKVTVSLGGTAIELWIGQNTATVNGTATLIDPNNPAVTPIILPPGRTMLPLRFIAENLGCQVNWDQTQQMVTVTYPAKP
ncbi:MAG: IPT/TIG domain-containing protein [Thermaerobacter sp.]|jgi:hypothetical protein|nr:IPT/TIG domain-containing protein [Thermaerobacter sp.]